MQLSAGNGLNDLGSSHLSRMLYSHKEGGRIVMRGVAMVGERKEAVERSNRVDLMISQFMFYMY